MRKFSSIKLATSITAVILGFILSSGAAFGVTSSPCAQASVTDVAGSLARASTDIRVRRLKQMFNNNQISADEYFVRATQPQNPQATTPSPQTAE